MNVLQLLLVLLLSFFSNCYAQQIFRIYVDSSNYFGSTTIGLNCSSGINRICTSLPNALTSFSQVTRSSPLDSAMLILAPGSYIGCYSINLAYNGVMHLNIQTPSYLAAILQCGSSVMFDVVVGENIAHSITLENLSIITTGTIAQVNLQNDLILAMTSVKVEKCKGVGPNYNPELWYDEKVAFVFLKANLNRVVNFSISNSEISNYHRIFQRGTPNYFGSYITVMQISILNSSLRYIYSYILSEGSFGAAPLLSILYVENSLFEDLSGMITSYLVFKTIQLRNCLIILPELISNFYFRFTSVNANFQNLSVVARKVKQVDSYIFNFEFSNVSMSLFNLYAASQNISFKGLSPILSAYGGNFEANNVYISNLNAKFYPISDKLLPDHPSKQCTAITCQIVFVFSRTVANLRNIYVFNVTDAHIIYLDSSMLSISTASFLSIEYSILVGLSFDSDLNITNSTFSYNKLSFALQFVPSIYFCYYSMSGGGCGGRGYLCSSRKKLINVSDSYFNSNNNLALITTLPIYTLSSCFQNARVEFILKSSIIENNTELTIDFPYLIRLLTFEKITFSNNLNSISNLIMYGSSPGGMLNIKNSSFQSNYCTLCSNGGSVIILGALITLNIQDSEFYHCNGQVGGCIQTQSQCIISIQNALFYNCSASLTNGGSIFIGSYSNIVIANSSFGLCSAKFLGGCIYVDHSSLVFFQDLLLNDSISSLKGGASFFGSNVSIVITNSVCRNCSADYGGCFYFQSLNFINISNSNFSSNTAFKEGGSLIAIEPSSLSIGNCNFTGGSANVGAAVHVSSPYRRFDVIGCVFLKNNAASFGGAMFLYNISNFLIESSLFVENSALIGGGIYLNTTRSVELKKSSFISNSAFLRTGDNCQGFSGIGGGIFVHQDLDVNKIYFESMNFTANRANWFGGAIGSLKNNESLFNSLYALTNFSSNSARYGEDFASLPQTIDIFLSALDVLISTSSQFSVNLRLLDYSGRSASIRECSIFLKYEFQDKESNNLLIMDPLEFSGIQWTDTSKYYQLPLRLKFKQALPVFPQAEIYRNVSLQATFPNIGQTLLSNVLNFTIRLCPPGYALEADSVLIYKCVPCLPGAFANSSDLYPTQCSKCPAGKYSFATMTYCSDCPKGRFSAEDGQAEACDPCSQGTFNSDMSQTLCSSCPIGKYTANTENTFCLSCPSNSTSFQERSISLLNCVCPFGYFGIPTKSGCLKCPNFRGLRCSANSSVPFVEQGFWRNLDHSDLVQRCFPSDSCSESGIESTNCNIGFQGKRCGDCAQNLFRLNQECRNCPSILFSWSVFVLVVLFTLGIYFKIMKSPARQNRIHIRSILISIQTLGVLSRFMDRKDSSSVFSSIMSVLDLTNLNLDLILSPFCIFKLEFWQTFTLKIFLIIGSFLLIYGIGFIATRLNRRKIDSSSLSQASYLEKSISTFVVVLSTLYTFVLSSIFSAFRCFKQDDGSFTLLSSPSLDCYDETWYSNLYVIVLGVLIIMIVPILLLLILFKHQQNRFGNHYYWKFGVLISAYKPKFYYWEFVLLMRKTIFVSLVDLTNNWVKLERSFIIICFLFFELFLDLIVQPHQDTHLPIFEIRCL